MARILARPAKASAKWIVSKVLSRIYLFIYFPIKRRLGDKFALAKNKVWYPFATKYVIHFFIVLLATGVIFYSIKTREASAEEFTTDSLITKFLGEDSSDIITETAQSAPKKSISYVDQRGMFGGQTLSINSPTEEETAEEDLTLAQGSGSILKPNIPTTQVGDRAREIVEYYVVEGGDTVSTIADKFGVSTNTILWENRLGEKDYIKPGDKLTILPMSGVSHQVKKGDTIKTLAKKYNVEEQEIIDYNKLASADAISVDEILIIPGGRAPEIVKPTSTGTGVDKYFGGTPPPPARVAASEKMLWPTASKKINQYFKYRHSGLDIDGNTGSPIYAAESGRVSNVGWGSGYGLHVIIDHGGGKKTVYAHFSKAYVTAGQQVSKGDSIGLMGCTGWCTGPHLHFEVIISGKKVNPLSYL
ncbi:MAG: peptidoglycan DD-metalloendopeptidase family protein [Patescibacteria group bacterium]|nr:peptidoglycan DD-metalloendopeptidase family protein [Patescibacteria group bacterium]